MLTGSVSAYRSAVLAGSGTEAMTISGSYSEVVRPPLEAEAGFPTVPVAGESLSDGTAEVLTSLNMD